MPTFRDSPVDDARAHELLTAYFEERASGFPDGPYAYLRSFPRAEQFTGVDGVFLVVLDGDSDVGCGGIRRIESESGVRFEVKHLWLKPSVRRRGYGRALLLELENRARQLGATELVLDTNSSLEAASELYNSSGFVPADQYNDNPNATNWYRKPLQNG